jgi:divalent metal cation (Fe/Co/Zn/Cd) transporter
VAWQFTRRDPERWEKPTLRVIAVAFFALAIYVTITSLLTLLTLLGRVEAEHSALGIVITALSVIVMPFLSLAERRAGRELGSASAVADSKQTLICAYLSAAVLAGLLLNSLFGWWWADAIAGLVIAGFAVREGVEAWRGDACATSVGMLLEDEHGDHHGHDRT